MGAPLTSMDVISETRLQGVHPVLAGKIRQLYLILAKKNIYIRVVQGLRTVAEQDALYARGRTAPGKRVTNAPGGFSYHNYGLAVDCDPSLYGPAVKFIPDWNESHPTWAIMEQTGIGLGLDSGAFWRTIHDAPHFQFTGTLPEGCPPESALLAFQKGGIPAVWEMAHIPIAPLVTPVAPEDIQNA
jgi:peptidoglycan L-alanyl-D-glutamate endopeptidase CwlK